MLLKIIPLLTVGVGIGLHAQGSKEKQMLQNSPVHQCCEPVCGINESPCTCFARGCPCEFGGVIEAEFLYWRAENRGQVIGFKQKGPDIAVSKIGRTLVFNPNWDPGFRLGLGWNTNFDRWDIFANWTWYHNRTKDIFSKDFELSSGNGFYPLYFQEPFAKTSASWHLHHQAIDLELGRAYYITQALSFRPHLGLRGAWLHQKRHIHFTEQESENPEVIEFLEKARNQYWGIGPRIGVHSQWHIANSTWSLLGKVSTSMLLGKTKAQLLNEQFLPDGSHFLFSHMKTKVSRLVPNLQLFFGLDWGSCLNCNRYFLGANVGWETNIYWAQDDVSNLNSDLIYHRSTEAVTMEGLTANIHFDF